MKENPACPSINAQEETFSDRSKADNENEGIKRKCVCLSIEEGSNSFQDPNRPSNFGIQNKIKESWFKYRTQTHKNRFYAPLGSS
jgi:hypothetical protein